MSDEENKEKVGPSYFIGKDGKFAPWPATKKRKRKNMLVSALLILAIVAASGDIISRAVMYPVSLKNDQMQDQFQKVGGQKDAMERAIYVIDQQRGSVEKLQKENDELKAKIADRELTILQGNQAIASFMKLSETYRTQSLNRQNVLNVCLGQVDQCRTKENNDLEGIKSLQCKINQLTGARQLPCEVGK